jgi:hypothetical protein
MNALKHGLHARTIVLPGEDAAAYQARLDTWRAEVKPRDALEESLLEQAVGLSWQLDRADRVADARLAERIRIAAEDEEARRQAEAVEAEDAGKRLMDGIPAPVFQRPGVDLLLDGKRLHMPIPPDDPDHPAKLLYRLESTAAGCQWLRQRWLELRRSLEANAGWQPAERLCAVRLLSLEPVDAIDDPRVQTIYLCSFVLDGNDPRVFADQADEMTRREFAYFFERMRGRGLDDLVPPSRHDAWVRLASVVDDIILRLEVRSASQTAQAHTRAATAAICLGIDTTREGERLRRLQSRLMNAWVRTMNRLTTIRSRPIAPALSPAPASSKNGAAAANPTHGADLFGAENLTISPVVPVSCANVRNEPNGAAPTAEEGMSAFGVPVAPDGTAAVGRRPRDWAEIVAASPVVPGSCANVRNEPNATAPAAVEVVAPVPIPGETSVPSRLAATHQSDARPGQEFVAASPIVPVTCARVRNEPNVTAPAIVECGSPEAAGRPASGTLERGPKPSPIGPTVKPAAANLRRHGDPPERTDDPNAQRANGPPFAIL